MADFVPVATQVQTPDFAKTLGALAQFQQAQAHSGLYQLQAQRQGMQIQALQEAAGYQQQGNPMAAFNALSSIDPELGKSFITGVEAKRKLQEDTLGQNAARIMSLPEDQRKEE
jgi:hypothetical protein